VALDPGGQGFRALEQLTVGELLFAPGAPVGEAVDERVGDGLRQFFRVPLEQAVEISDNGLKALLRHGLTLHMERLSAGQAIHAH
jgi:hypothetical protein